MTITEAYHILGLSPDAAWPDIKKQYRKLMMQAHPDSGILSAGKSVYQAQEINTAYTVLKNRLAGPERQKSAAKKETIMWNAPLNPNAYMDREILHYVEDYDGTVIGQFCVAKGKYLWTLEEEFSLFLLSMYHCSKQLLDEIDTSLSRQEDAKRREQIQPELTYLLTQQFIDGASCLPELAKETAPDQDGHRIFYLPSMLESSGNAAAINAGEPLYPSRIRHHKLYLKDQKGTEAGYLSFLDDRLYYIVIPLLEQKSVQIKIQAAKRQPAASKKRIEQYQNLHVWIKLYSENQNFMPENLNLQIRQLLRRYTL